MERVWKEFGKHTPAGKLLYDLYGIGYKPENHINYPKLQPKKPLTSTNKDEKIEKNLKPGNKTKTVLNKINYPKLDNNIKFPEIHKVDMIRKRKNQNQI